MQANRKSKQTKLKQTKQTNPEQGKQTKQTNQQINPIHQTIKPKYMSLAIKTFALVALLFTATSTFATTPADDSNNTVTVAFHKDFKKAELIATETRPNFSKLTFRLNGVILYAFYSDAGQLLAVTRNITSNQLPLQLLLEVKKDYSDFWITDLFEITSDGATNYYITVENANSRVTLRSNGADNWELYKKVGKE
jgi:hypothetical protein